MVKLSIVISYYKTYELTEKLLEVLIPQLTDEVEVFLVDDGCNELRLDKFKEIDITHLQENGGEGVAKNVGIRKATGKYIGFIDADDMISNNYIQELLNAIDNCNADLIYFDWQDMSNGMIIQRPSNYAPWRSIYKREIIPLFVEDRRFSVDVPFQDEINSVERERYDIDKVLYYYNSNREGCLTLEKERLIKEGKL